MLVYDKEGVSYNVPHIIDVKEWISTGLYFDYNPKDTESSNDVEESNDKASSFFNKKK